MHKAGMDTPKVVVMTALIISYTLALCGPATSAHTLSHTAAANCDFSNAH
jgi:hypothetical protein